MDKEFSDDSKSVYNEGLFQIQRLNNSWVKCNYYSSKGMFKEWRWELDVIWRELSYDTFKLNNGGLLSDWDELVDVKVMDKLDKDINKAFVSTNNADKYRLLTRKEVFLRVLQHKVGKGSKYEDDDVRRME